MKQIECPKHGLQNLHGNDRCGACNAEYVKRRRRKIKDLAVEYAGGECTSCGFKGHRDVFDFHHVNPEEKDFSISQAGYSWEAVRKEVDKCVLLCANCHRLVHADAD